MKKTIIFIFASLVVNFSNAQAPDSWTEKKGLGLAVPASAYCSSRISAASFGINDIGYIGTGNDGGVADLNDFWQYDPTFNLWTQKASFAGTARQGAVGFSIGNKGYIGTGKSNGIVKNDFWEYDPSSNTWTQKANFGGAARYRACGFSLNGKGYIGTGGSNLNDFWEYDPVTDTWAQKANFGGTGRVNAVGFSIGSKGYIGTGNDGTYKNDFWEYDPVTNAWTAKADFTGGARSYAVGFSDGVKGYLGTGTDGSAIPYKNDFWEYNPSTNLWTQKANFGGGERAYSTAISIGTFAFVVFSGLVGPYNTIGVYKGDLWQYVPAQNFWYLRTYYDATARCGAVGFPIGNKGYLGTGWTLFIHKNDFWEYNPAANAWTQKANFAGTARRGASCFSIGNKGYIGTGYDNTYKNDFWEYDALTNTWTEKTNFGGATRQGAVGFSIGDKGYIGTGYQGTVHFNDFWEYNPVSDSWTQKTDFGGAARVAATGFSIGNKGYLGTGNTNGNLTKDFWEYDLAANAWTQKADIGNIVRQGAVGFSLGGKGYISTAWTSSGYRKDVWEYDPFTNTWTQKNDFAGSARYAALAFTIGQKGYLGTGDIAYYGALKNDFWEYTPVCNTPVSTIYSSGSSTFCNGDSVFLYANNGYNYQWKKNGVDITGATSYFYYAKATGSYTCNLTNSCGAVTSSAISVTVNSLPLATITPAGATTFCSGGDVVLNAPVAANRTYQWKKGAYLISGATLSSYTATTGGNYRVIVTNTVTGCSKTTGSATAVTVNALPSATITTQGPTTFCAGGSVVLAANTGAGLTYKWKKGGGFISGATLSNYTATTGGNYRVEVTNSNGCSKTSALVAVSVPCKVGEMFVPENNFDVKVFPNPSSGDFVFEILNVSTEKIAISVYDMIGKLVLSENSFHSQFTIRNQQLTPGIYSAEIIYRENKKVVKLVKTN